MTNSTVATTKPKTIEEIRAEVKTAMAAKLKLIKEEAEIGLLTNENFQNILIKQQLRDMSTEKLATLITQCEQIVTDNPLHNKTLRQQRTFNPSRRYGLGNQYALLSGLLSGIQYSVLSHSELMLSIIPLSPDLIETTLQYQGQLPYYSANYAEVVVGTKADAKALHDNILVIESILGITIDKSAIKQDIMDRQYDLALAKAEKVKEETDTASELQQFVLR